MKKDKSVYQITPKGIISLAANDDQRTQAIWDGLELYCYRNGYNAIIIDKKGGQFVKVEREEKQ